MKLQVPFIQLPLLFDAEALAREVLAIDESCWKPHPQGFAGNSMLPLVAVDGDPANETFDGPMLPTPHLRACPYLQQVFAGLGATIGRSRLMRLSGQAEVSRHFDQGYYWADRVRVHVPIVTQPTVRFECGDMAVNMAAGECWIFDTWRMHRVINDADAARIHLVVDTVGGSGFWDLVGRGRAIGAPPRGPWEPKRVQPAQGVDAEFPLESVNVPVVMSPWEMRSHFGLLFGDALPHPQLQQVQWLAAQLLRGWQGLWAQYGESRAGHQHYRALLDRFQEQALPLSEPLLLNNNGGFQLAMRLLILQSAIGDGTPRNSSEYGSDDRG
ncbi:hypothetical protein GCM10025793_10680 [Lysobacter lycopersici]